MIKKFGFESKGDFIEVVMRDKILELKKQFFFELSDDVSAGLKKKGIKRMKF